MSPSDVDLLGRLLAQGVAPVLILAFLIAGVLVTKREADQLRAGIATWQQMYREKDEQAQRDRELIKDMTTTMARVLEELQLLNRRAP